MIRKKGFTLTANARYSSVEVDFEDEDISKGYNPEDISLNGCHVFGQLGFTSMFNTRLFGKYFMGMAMVDSEWGARKFQRISGIAMALCMLRVNRNTQFGLGPIILVNSCSRIPAFLVFMYRHRFNDRWLLNLYGGMFGVDYTLTKNDLISIGADIDVKSFYFKPHNENLPRNCRFTSTSFRPMAKYRRRLGRNLYLDVQGGISLKMSSRVNGVSSSKQYFECRQKTAPFLQAGVSYSLWSVRDAG